MGNYGQLWAVMGECVFSKTLTCLHPKRRTRQICGELTRLLRYLRGTRDFDRSLIGRHSAPHPL